MDAAAASVVVASIAAVGGVASTAIAIRQRPKIDEVHHQMVTNHHESDPPTVLDRLDSLESKVEEIAASLVTLAHLIGTRRR